MNQQSDKVEVTVEEVKEAAASSRAGDAGVVIHTESTVNGRMCDTSIEVREDDAPAVAAALLNAEVARPTGADDLPQALHCLAVGLVEATGAGQVRLHVQLNSGQVLPIEMSNAAADALARALSERNGTR